MNLKGLFNPKNASDSANGMREGLVRVDNSVYRVHQPKPGDNESARTPFLALVWQVTRLDETLSPIVDEETTKVEELVFSAGGKSLISVHPGEATGPDDEHITDKGVEVNTEGNTVFLLNTSWRPHKKSGLTKLLTSLRDKGTKEEWLDRVWAPDFIGCIFHLKSEDSGEKVARAGKDGKLIENALTYKVVTDIKRGMGSGSLKSTKTNKIANGKDVTSEIEAIIKPVIEQLSESQSGQSVTKKGLRAFVTRMLAESGANPKLVVPALELLGQDAWLTANGPKYGFTFDIANNSLSFS